MVGAKTQGPRQFGFPAGQRLAFPGIDQIKADPAKIALRNIKRRQPHRQIMWTPQLPQRDIIERLKTKGHPVDPGGGKAGKPRCLHTRWIGLQRDLQTGCHRPKPRHRIDNRARRRRVHQ